MLRNDVIEWARNEFKRNRVPSQNRAVKKFTRLYKAKFYKLFPGGIDELWNEAGYRPKGNTSTAFPVSKSVQIEPIHVSVKERYEETIKKTREALEELSYGARVDPAKAWEFAEKVLPLTSEDLWEQFIRMSNGEPERAFREALAIAGGPYGVKIMKQVASGQTPDDSYEQFLAWNQGIIRDWFQMMVSQKKGRLLSPGIVNGNCRTCDSRLFLTSEGSIKCRTCRIDHLSWICDLCGSEHTIIDDIYQISCQNCGFRRRFNSPLLRANPLELRRKAIMKRYREEFGDVVDTGGYVIEDHGVPTPYESFRNRANRKLKEESS